MAKADTRKLLKKIEKFVGSEVRKQVAGQYTRVTFTAEGIGQGIKEGYQSLQERLGDEYFLIEDKDFTSKIGAPAIKTIYNWASQDKTTPHEVEIYVPNVSITYIARRDVIRPYTLAKNTAVQELQKIRVKAGKRKLLGKTQEDKTAATSELGIVKTRVHKLHKGTTTVGAAQLAASMQFLERTRDFAGFASSESAKDLMNQYYKQVQLVWKSVGTKKSGEAQVSLLENLYVEMVVDSMSKNPAGGEPFDWKNIRPVLEDAIEKYLVEAELADQKGSKSIRENATNMVEHLLVSELSKVKNSRVQRKTKASYRNKVEVSTTFKAKRSRPKKSNKKTPTTRIYSKSSSASMPLQLMVLINKDLPRVVAKNMGSTALNYRTGRFASSVRVTDVVTTPKGFPSMGYTYDKDRYQTFEPGFAQGSVDRDPRKLIDKSMREIAAQYAVGRFFTRRV
jgi:hypothetical protein